jgi:hypothetical protein
MNSESDIKERSADLEMVLEDVLVSSDVAPLDKFMVADTLALWEFLQPDKSGFVKLVRAMEQLAKEHDLGGDTPSRLAMKQMLVASLNGETAGIRLYSARSLALADSPMLRGLRLIAASPTAKSKICLRSHRKWSTMLNDRPSMAFRSSRSCSSCRFKLTSNRSPNGLTRCVRAQFRKCHGIHKRFAEPRL